MMTFREVPGLLLPYSQARATAQHKSVALVIRYLMFFQIVIVEPPIAQVTLSALGFALVIVGLTVCREVWSSG